jgi:xylulokinase
VNTICLDVGTSVIKAVAYDAAGGSRGLARRPAVVDRPRPGWSEQDMAGVWVTAVELIRELGQRAGPVDRLAVTGQGDGCWLVGGGGAPTGPALLWNDARAVDIVDRWRSDGRLAEAFAVSGSATFPGLANALLTWLRANDPDRLDRSTAALTCTGWVFSQLTGVIGIHPSEASAPFFGVATSEYSDELIGLFDLDWARPLLPPVLTAPTAPLARLAARALGVPAGIPVVMAPYDVPATALGVGAAEPGQVACVLGTTLSAAAFGRADVVQAALRAAAPAGLTLHGVLDGQRLRAMPSLAGTEVLDWCARLLGVAGPAELGELAAGVSPDPELIFLPYLSPAGERAPFVAPNARGSLHGLSLRHGRGHVARAVFAGLTLAVRDCVAALGVDPAEIRVAGGGARSSLWLQLLADACGVPVIAAADEEAGARGALIAAALAVGDYPDAGAACAELTRSRPGVRPSADSATCGYADFIAARRAAESLWPGAGPPS